MKRSSQLFSDTEGARNSNVKFPRIKEPATPTSSSPQPFSCENDAVQVLEKLPTKEEPAPTSPPSKFNPETPLKTSRQERRRKEREQKKRERKCEFVLHGPYPYWANSFLDSGM
jgi:hypothetical protein